ncbi:1,4-dihydropyridine esterase [Streptomyces paludis]|uniref:1,4-dihydropyridine esterase n=2 Tax=Streptomyces paludis TaxID=2282738 RepID=A0A345HUJ4_9ACTN|nr:1,4-dihydropyridine esterase [Streptomyces paludis]
MVAALLTAGLVSGATTHTATASGTGDAGTAGVAGPRAAAGGSVTLITGDQVRMDGKGRVTRVEPGKGREGTRMHIKAVGDETYVLPADAARLVAQGTLDQRLFNVTALLEAGYGDERRASLPLIVSYGKNAARKAEAKAAIADADVAVRRTLPAIGGEALTAPKEEAAEVWDALTEPTDVPNEARETVPGIERVWLDGKRTALLDKSGAQIGTWSAYQAGYTGVGVKVAVLDSGVDQTHPDLAGVSIARKDFSGSGNTVDHFGHGTHVASTIAGSGAKSGWKYLGVAPGAKIIDAKVLDDGGVGEDSGIIAGMQWAADQGARIVNLSLGFPDAPGIDPLEAAVNKLSAEKNVLFVVAAGNEGPDGGTVRSPGSAAAALTVGAVDREDRIADFSSTGPTADGSLKPDITAPGVDIVAAKSTKADMGGSTVDGYVSLSGTSMAAPHVAGAAAILAQQHPDWSGQRIKKALVSSARPGAGQSVYQQGTGRADLTAAITQTVLSEQTGVNFGTHTWPHTYALPVTKDITYNNTGTAPVTLDLSLETAGPGGRAVPDGFFMLGATKITVPANGRVAVPLRANINIGAVDGALTGTVVAKATDGSQSVRTTFGAVREVESYDITLKFIDNNGKPSKSSASVYGHNDLFRTEATATRGDGTVTVRLPKGSYTLNASVETGADLALLVQPKLIVTESTTVTFDAREAKPVSITAPDSAELREAYVSFDVNTNNGAFNFWLMDSFDGVRVGHVGPQVPKALLNAQVGGTWQKGGTSYNLVYNRTGSFFKGFSHKATMSELALVNVKFGSSAKNRRGDLSPTWTSPSVSRSVGTMTSTFALPATVKAYVTTPDGFTWHFGARQLDSKDADTELELQSVVPKVYEAEKSYGETFNVGVFSPKVLDTGVKRFRNGMEFCVSEFTDGVGHLGTSTVSNQRSTVVVNGKTTVFDDPYVLCGTAEGLPAESATIRMSTEATRPTSVAGVSTRLVAAWTFTSKEVTGSAPANLPINFVRFTPSLDLTSTAKAGETVTFPLHVRGPAQHNLGSLTVQVSYDGGKVWTNTPVTYGTGTDGRHHITLTHPTTATSVSLKAKLTDTSGNAYDVTIEKAYLLN